MIETALLTACAVVALDLMVARLQSVSGLWRAPAATCEGLPSVVAIPVPVPMPPKGTGL